MFGVHFIGNQDFRRLLLPPDWQGHPLLKDYREPDFYRGISTIREDIPEVKTETGSPSDPEGRPDPAT
jgi:NADH-quinone oxidoreductase subunit C